MVNSWDITAYDRKDQLALVAEVKRYRGATPEWAAKWRRNILAHGTYPNAPFVLMAFPDRFYLWKDAAPLDETLLPTYSVDARPLLRRYFDQSGLTAESVSGSSLELIVTSWLGDIMHQSQSEIDPSQHWLTDSGLYQAVAGGRIEHEILV